MSNSHLPGNLTIRTDMFSESIHDNFASRLAAAVDAFKVGDGFKEGV